MPDIFDTVSTNQDVFDRVAAQPKDDTKISTLNPLTFKQVLGRSLAGKETPGEKPLSNYGLTWNPKFLAQQAPMVLPTLGAIGGAAGAGLLGLPSGPGAIGAAAAGAGAGFEAGMTANRGIARLMGQKFQEPSLGQKAIETAVGASSELVGPALKGMGNVATRLLGAGAKNITPEAAQAAGYLAEKGLPGLMPDEATKGGMRRYMTALTQGAPIGGTELRDYLSKRNATWTQFAKDEVNRVLGVSAQMGEVGSRENAGHAAATAIDLAQDSFHDVANVAYDEIKSVADPKNVAALEKAGKQGGNEMLQALQGASTSTRELNPGLVGATEFDGGAKIPMQEVKEEAKRLADELKSSGVNPPSVLNEIQNSGDQTWFSKAQGWRSQLRSLDRVADEANVSNRKSGAVATTLGKLDSAIRTGLDTLNPELAKELDVTDAMYRQGRQQYYNSFVNQLIKTKNTKGVEFLTDAIFDKNAVTQTRQAIAATSPEAFASLGEHFKGTRLETPVMQAINQYKQNLTGETYNQLKGVFVNRIVSDSIADGTFSGTAFKGKLDSYGRDMLYEAFGKNQTEDLYRMSQALAQGEKNGNAIGSWIVKNKQLIGLAQTGVGVGSALAAMTSGEQGKKVNPYYATSAALFLGGPYVVGKLWTNPVTRRWLIDGIQASPATQSGAKAIAKLGAAAFMANQDRPEEDSTNQVGQAP